MGLWVFLTLVIAFIAFMRAARAEKALTQQKQELAELREWLQRWYDQSQAAQAQARAAAAAGAGHALASADPAVANASTTAATGLADAQAAALAAGTPPLTAASPTIDRQAAELQAESARLAGSTTAQAGAGLQGAALASATPSATEPAAQAFSAHQASATAGGGATAGAGATAAHAPGGPSRPLFPTTTEAEADADDLENRIGGRWLLYIGIAALVLGASYFVKYAFDNGWVNEPLRIGIGLVAGLALIVGGQRFVARGLVLYGQVLTGGGVGVIYLSIYAAQQWYGLINQPTAAAGMIATTGLAVWLADRQRSQPLALMAIIAGFATPFLIEDSPGSQVPLFIYDAILVCGTLALARRRDWPMLNLASYALTLFTIAAWLEYSYDPRRYYITEAFLTLFLVLFLWIWREMRRHQSPGADFARVTLAVAPLLYHLASLSILFPKRGALLVYLIAFSAAGVIAARRLERPWLRLATWVGGALPLLASFVQLPGGWLIAAWVALFSIYGLHLVAQVDRVQDETESLPWEEVILLHANGIWLLFAAHMLLEGRMLYAEARVSLALAVWYGALTFAARAWRRDVALHTVALTATFVAAAAGFYFQGPWFTVALAVDGAALMWLALKADRRWMYAWGGLILVLAITRVLVQFTLPTPVSYLPILNPHALTGLFVVAIMGWVAWLSGREGAGRRLPGARDALIVSANLLALGVLSAEVYQYFDHRAWSTGVGAGGGRSAAIEAEAETNAHLSRELSLSLLWALYAVGMVFAGIKRRYRPIRYFAILLFGFTILKVFTVDLATLDRVSKMLSVMGLGVLLLLASYLYQRVSADTARASAGRPVPQPEPQPEPDAQPDPGPTADPAPRPISDAPNPGSDAH